jgi:hypothetical protein
MGVRCHDGNGRGCDMLDSSWVREELQQVDARGRYAGGRFMERLEGRRPGWLRCHVTY